MPNLAARFAAAMMIAAFGGRACAAEACPLYAADYDVAKVIEAMKRPKPNLVVLTPHRGLIEEHPENTLEAIKAAVDAGFESVEIDLRMNRDHSLWLMHDAVADRLTTAVGYFSAYSDDALKALGENHRSQLIQVKDRHGKPTVQGLSQFEQVLDYQAERMPDRRRGFVLVVDIKSPVKDDPFISEIQVMNAFEKAVSKTANRGLLNAVLFKMKAREITEHKDQFDRILQAYPQTPVMVTPVLHPNEEVAGNQIITAYLGNYRNFVGFETVVENDTQETALGWWEQLLGAGRTVPAFLSWNEFPEGVAKSDATCCVYRHVRPPGDLDFTGTVPWQLRLQGRWLTSDAAQFLHRFYCARDNRNLQSLR